MSTLVPPPASSACGGPAPPAAARAAARSCRTPAGSAGGTGSRPATRWAAGRCRRIGVSRCTGPADARHRGEEPLGVGVRRPGEQVRGRRLLHDLSRVHHRHPVGAARHDAEIVGDEQHRHAPARGGAGRAPRGSAPAPSRRAPSSARRPRGSPAPPRARWRSSPAGACRRSAGGGRRRAGRPGSGMPTSCSRARARSRASARDTGKCARTPSAIWSPTVNTGLRLVIGSWKIMPTRRPRICRSASPSSASTSVSPSRMTLPGRSARAAAPAGAARGW